MDQIIKTIRTIKIGYSLVNDQIQPICYADDLVLAAENKDDLKHLLFMLNVAAKKFNMKISMEKTKSIVISKEQIRYKLVVDIKIKEQVGRVDISSD